MPEYEFTMKVNFYALDEDDSHEVAEAIATLAFVDDAVNSLEAGIPIFVKEDD